ncbi:MAG: dynamin family protein [Betaproteobacteria bacterium]|nr:dynamin family protein [Betaproteobacteria bacterium]MCC6246195.1 dynamin family protein [Rubrivivax sp.]
MKTVIARQLDALAGWRAAVDKRVQALAALLAASDLLDDAASAQIVALRERLASDKLVLAFVAEFSRGKSELINAIFFADAGRRVLPATPGRTTMCPVELRHEAGLPPRLSLLPMETRLRGLSLAELRGREEPWQHVPLEPRNPQALTQALAAVTRTQRVTVERATALGFWNAEQPEDNPPQGPDGLVEVPAWRHALINYPHPLLEAGLVVIDTPGLNAIGAEPELTLGLLPTAHAVVFVLAADTGVTRTDLAIWRDHLGGASLERFVVLNKIDTLVDPLATADEVAEQIEQQREGTAATLKIPLARVFALSARNALSARVGHDAEAVAASRIPPLERSLALELMPRRHELLVAAAVAVVQQLHGGALHRLSDRRRHTAEQLFELRGLRGKSSSKLVRMLERVEAEAAEFEHCTARLAALRSVQMRQLREMTTRLSNDTLRREVAQLQERTAGRPFNLGGKSAFGGLVERLRAVLSAAERQADEMRQMLEASFTQLNTEFGFALVVGPAPGLESYRRELKLIEDNYSRYFGFHQAWRMAQPGFAEQFRRMLLSKLRVIFENAAAELELWSKASSGQIEMQLRERRRGFARRRESLERVQSAAGELELRIAEVQQQEDHLVALIGRIDALAANAVSAARCAPGEEEMLVDAIVPGGQVASLPATAAESRRVETRLDEAAALAGARQDAA